MSEKSDNDAASEALANLERAIEDLQDPFGDEQHLRLQERAVLYLIEHAEDAHPRLLRLLEDNKAANPFAVVEALPRFGRPESVPVLENILRHGSESLSQAAGEALARHPLSGAQEVLLRALTDPRDATVIAAADGLMSRGNPQACGELVKVLEHRNPLVRYRVVQAAGVLGCLEEGELRRIGRDDSDEDIRELAVSLLGKKSKG